MIEFSPGLVSFPMLLRRNLISKDPLSGERSKTRGQFSASALLRSRSTMIRDPFGKSLRAITPSPFPPKTVLTIQSRSSSPQTRSHQPWWPWPLTVKSFSAQSPEQKALFLHPPQKMNFLKAERAVTNSWHANIDSEVGHIKIVHRLELAAHFEVFCPGR
jgi:hypothetical protein